ncbi:MAG: hypothetical protein AAFN93_27575, partial [Bacteroidota bacterium]
MKNSLYLLLVVIVASCQPKETNDAQEVEATPSTISEGPVFNVENSDPKAIEIADKVMEAMGGQSAWDSLRYISWNFFGARDLVWDKQTGRVRIDFPRDSSVFLVNINTMEGKVMRNEAIVTDSLEKELQTAKSIWINDSYWLVMPFKLKDPGVTLTYAREYAVPSGEEYDVLELNFEGVGNTPNNKYEVFVDRSDNLIKQWSYFKDAAQDSVSATWPWNNYQEYQGVMLSSDRSDNKGPKNVQVF